MIAKTEKASKQKAVAQKQAKFSQDEKIGQNTRIRAEAEGAMPGIGGAGNFRAQKYAAIRLAHPDWPDVKCKREAGYAPDTIPKGPIINDLRARIRAAQDAAGITVQGNLERLVHIRDMGEDKDAITAIKVITEITGERMPEEIDLRVHNDDRILDRLLADFDNL